MNLGQLARREPPANLVQVDHKESRAPKEQQVRMVLLARPDQQVLTVRLVQRARPVQRARSVQQVLTVRRAPPDHRGQLAHRAAHLDPRVHPDRLAFQDPRVHRVQQVPSVHREAHRVQRDLPARPDQGAHRVRKVHKAFKVFRASRVQLVRPAQPVWEPQVQLVRKESKVQLVRLVQPALAPRAQQGRRDLSVRPGLPVRSDSREVRVLLDPRVRKA